MKKNLVSIFILIFTGLAISYFLFEPVLREPSAYLFSKGGDAVKSYWNFSYYLRYDNGFRHDGINYPYGDHLQYMNSHPLYVSILKFIDTHLFQLQDYGPGILNLTMIFSLVLALPFLFLILRKFGLPAWYSIFFSLIILYTTPQFDRIHGHFEMVYAFFIPLFFYLFIRFFEGKRLWLWSLLLILSGLAGGFTSAYYAAFYAIFGLALMLAVLWKNRRNAGLVRNRLIILFLVSIAPVIIVKGMVSLTDWAGDRPDNPWGFFIFHSNIFSIFLPHGSDLQYVLGDPAFMRFQWEGRAYVGLPAALLALFIFISLVFSLFTKEKLSLKKFFPDENLNLFLLAAFLVLLFSMCFPFKYGLAFLKDWISPVKQFRALGRFSWIFYYVFTVYTAVFIFSLIRKLWENSNKTAAVSLFVIITAFWAVDAGVNIKRSVNGLQNKNDLLESSSLEYRQMLKSAGINTEDYQAVFFLPFANTCGDKLLFEKGMEAFKQAMKCSYHTGLPIMQSFSPRLPFSNAMSSIQMLADPAIRKIRLKDMNEKPILLLIHGNELNPEEKWMADRGEELLKYGQVRLARFKPELLESEYFNWWENARKRVEKMKYTHEGLLCDTLPEFIFYKSFDDEIQPEFKFRGSGSLWFKSGKTELIGPDLFRSLGSGKYEVSFWMYTDHRIDNMPEVIFYHRDEKGELKERNKWNTREEHNVVGKWVRIDQLVELTDTHNYSLEVKGKYVSLDELLVRPAISNVYLDGNGDFPMFNNFPEMK